MQSCGIRYRKLQLISILSRSESCERFVVNTATAEYPQWCLAWIDVPSGRSPSNSGMIMVFGCTIKSQFTQQRLWLLYRRNVYCHTRCHGSPSDVQHHQHHSFSTVVSFRSHTHERWPPAEISWTNPGHNAPWSKCTRKIAVQKAPRTYCPPPVTRQEIKETL